MSKDLQPLLLPEDMYNNLREEIPNPSIEFLTLDETPSYKSTRLLDDIKFKKVSLPNDPTTPLDLISPNHKILNSMQIANSLSRTLESVCSVNSDSQDIVAVVDSPIKSLAWVLFLTATQQRQRDIATDMNFIKSYIETFEEIFIKRNIPREETAHFIKLSDPENYIDNDILRLRTKIFNGCLQTSAKIFTSITNKPVIKLN